MRALAFERFHRPLPREVIREDSQSLDVRIALWLEVPRTEHVRLLRVFVMMSDPDTLITTALESRFLARQWTKRRCKRVG